MWNRPTEIIGEWRRTERIVCTSWIVASPSGILDLPNQATIVALDPICPPAEPFKILLYGLRARQSALKRHHAQRLRHDERRASGSAVYMVLNELIRNAAAPSSSLKNPLVRPGAQ
jgi:hypothetical protein